MRIDGTAMLIIEIVWGLSVGRSLLIIMFGTNTFRKAYKNEKSAMILILNLFTMLDIAEVSTYWGILFFVPFLNLVPLVLMGLGLGKTFNTSLGYKLGLVFLPIVFYPMLLLSNKPYKVGKDEYFKALDSVKAESVNLMTEEEIQSNNELTAADVGEIEVDSIFKSKIELMEEAPTYKAVRIDKEILNGMDDLKQGYDEFAPIKKVDPPVFETKAPMKEAFVKTSEIESIPEIEKPIPFLETKAEPSKEVKEIESIPEIEKPLPFNEIKEEKNDGEFKTYGEKPKDNSKEVEFLDL